jgi:hypothetical protein
MLRNLTIDSNETKVPGGPLSHRVLHNHRCENLRSIEFKNRLLRKIFAPKRDEVKGSKKGTI